MHHEDAFLHKQLCDTDIELLQRRLRMQAVQVPNPRQKLRICLPPVDYEFELLRLALGKTMGDWIGSHKYFVYVLVSRHFREVVQILCPLLHDPQRCRLRVGDCVSSLQLTASTTKKRNMCRGLHRQAGECNNPVFINWMKCPVHIFRILAGPQEMKSLHPSQSPKESTWLLVPHLPWEHLFDVFRINPHRSFLVKRRRLKRILINVCSLCVSFRAGLWMF